MDSFRTRTPNTSRPPSMHVDDFMKLEKGQNEINSNAVLPIRRVDSLIQRVKHIYCTCYCIGCDPLFGNKL